MSAPTSASNWHALTFQSAVFWRREAARWEDLAVAADRDGDVQHGRSARWEAANCRHNARLKEIGA